jgi:hypothetical protein
MKIKIWICVLILLLTRQATGSDFGECAGVVYKLPTSARISALGDCGVIVEEQAGVCYNPAVLTGIEKSFSFSYIDGVVDSYFSYLGTKFKMKGFDAGISLSFLDGGKFKHYVYTQDEPADEFKAQSDFYLLFAGAKKIYEVLSFGAALKFLQSKLAKDYSANSIALDAGIIYSLGNIKLGASLQNLGSGLKYYKENNPLPILIRVGIAGELRQELFVVAEIKNIPKEGITAGFGIEYLLFDILYLRGGYKLGFDAKNISFGFGIDYKNIVIDYAYSPIKDLQSQHRVSLSFKLLK